MIRYSITAPRHLRGTVALPSSKSMSNRALIMYALSGGGVFPENLSDCDDTKAMLCALEQEHAVVDIGAAGTAMRFLTAYFAVRPGERTLTGTARMQERPIGTLVDALRSLGADISYSGKEGYPPLLIRGKALQGGMVEIPGDISSQYISALLMVAPVLEGGLTVRLRGEVSSRPYIDLTIHQMHEYGADVQWTANDTISVKPGGYVSRQHRVESDWSAASYWYEMMLLSGDDEAQIRLSGLQDSSRQGDSMVRFIGSLLGLKTKFVTDTDTPQVLLRKQRQPVQRLNYDFANCPDLAQSFVVACAAMDIPFHFTGLASLKIKETDRIEALKTELRKVGVVLRTHAEGDLIWEGGRCEASMEPFDTYQDHRMAMALAPLALKYGTVQMNDPGVVSKSYPNYWDDLRQMGFKIE